MSKAAVLRLVLFVAILVNINGRIEDENSEDHNLESSERIGPLVTQVVNHPYAASLLRNNTYTCSAVILNHFWLITLSKCFDVDIITGYVIKSNLDNYTIRVGSSYNEKGGSIFRIQSLTNNFDMKVSLVKLMAPLEYTTRVAAIRIPVDDEKVSLGDLVQMVAWTPNGHIRIVNAPIINSNICEAGVNVLPGHYICVGGVQDLNRHFCRKDNGGAVVQNKTLIGITTFVQPCAHYTKVHAFPNISNMSSWINSVVWDEEPRPTEPPKPTTFNPTTPTKATTNATVLIPSVFVPEANNYMLPFDPISVPLVPAEDNSVLPKLSYYESYMHHLEKARTSTTADYNSATLSPSHLYDQQRAAWIQKVNKAMLMMKPPPYAAKHYDDEDFDTADSGGAAADVGGTSSSK